MKNILSLIFLFFFVSALSPAFAEETNWFKSSSGYKDVKIERIIKSDLVLLDNGKKIHLIGIKVFDEPKRGNRPTDKYGFVIEDSTSDPTTSIEDRAYEFASELMENKKVRVEYDVKTIDADGFILGYVFLPNGTMANAEILRQGFAELHIQPPNLKYADQLREAYREARSEKRGVHAD